MASFFYFTNDRQEYNSGLFTVYSLSHMVNSFTSCGSNLLSAFSNSLQNKSELKLTFFKTVLVYSNIALAIRELIYLCLYNVIENVFVYKNKNKK